MLDDIENQSLVFHDYGQWMRLNHLHALYESMVGASTQSFLFDLFIIPSGLLIFFRKVLHVLWPPNFFFESFYTSSGLLIFFLKALTRPLTFLFFF